MVDVQNVEEILTQNLLLLTTDVFMHNQVKNLNK